MSIYNNGAVMFQHSEPNLGPVQDDFNTIKPRGAGVRRERTSRRGVRVDPSLREKQLEVQVEDQENDLVQHKTSSRREKRLTS